MISSHHLIIFVKAPRSGGVKTRLARAIGEEAACAAYKRLAEELIEHLATFPSVELRFTPDEAVSEITPWRRRDWQLHPQGEGDLGVRLERAFADAFASGGEYVAAIGSDCPAITPEDIQSAWAALRTSDVVLGPARDGGYWLIGVREPRPALFQTIDWSTDQVLKQTMRRAQVRNLKVELLRELSDVDTESDWMEFLDQNRRVL
jgi:rSAM/selenodomain-associated transferase 1